MVWRLGRGLETVAGACGCGCPMSLSLPGLSEPAPAPAPAAFRDALAELVAIGMTVARMVGRAAEHEIALAASPSPIDVDPLPVAETLDQAIAADRAYAEAATARETALGRSEAIAGSFERVSRAVRRTVLLAERLERGWARHGLRDDREGLARRQVARGVADAIARGADAERVERLTELAAERLDSLDDVGGRPAEEIIAEICRDLGLDVVRGTVKAPDLGPMDASFSSESGLGTASAVGSAGPAWRRPDG